MKLDKLLHALVGALIAAYLIPLSVPIAIAAVILAALGKEAYDWLTHGKPDVYDALATVVGGVVSFVFFNAAVGGFFLEKSCSIQ